MESKPILNVPVAIVIAGAIIAAALIWNKKPVDAPVAQQAKNEVAPIRPVSDADHILGNPNAKIKIVEYSDPACPYCKVFHSTMRKIIDTYGKDGQVAWVYRSFPLDSPDANGNILHKNAGVESQALECAAKLGGNDKFWLYTNRLYEITPSVTGATPEGLDPSQLPVIAAYAGLDKQAFLSCLQSGEMKDKVNRDYLDGINAGISGTPSSFIISPNGSQIPMSGAQPFDVVKKSIDALLGK